MTTRESIYSKRMKNIPRMAIGTSDNSVISCNEIQDQGITARNALRVKMGF